MAGEPTFWKNDPCGILIEEKHTKSMRLTGHPSLTCIECKLRITNPPKRKKFIRNFGIFKIVG
jgi:hypothetical protein